MALVLLSGICRQVTRSSSQPFGIIEVMRVGGFCS
jgi:hypothetical protein